MNQIKIIVFSIILTNAGAGGLGEVISSFEVPSALKTADGLAWDGEYLWACSEPGYNCYKTTTTGFIVSSFGAGPGPYNCFVGATFDGTYLWISNRDPRSSLSVVTAHTTTGSLLNSFMVNVIDNDTGLTYEAPYLWVGSRKYTTEGSLIASFSHRGVELDDTAFVDGYLWASGEDWAYVYQWTTTGSVVGSFAIPGGGRPSGKTFDGTYLWVVNADNGWCYQIDIGAGGMGGGGLPEPQSMDRLRALYR